MESRAIRELCRNCEFNIFEKSDTSLVKLVNDLEQDLSITFVVE